MFREVLKRLRKEHGITQEQLAEIIGVERSSVGKYESPKANVMPSNDVLQVIADFFGVSVDYLLERTCNPNSDTIMELTNLKILRKKQGLLQQQVAEALGITQQAYANYEIGKREPDNKMLKKLAGYFDVSTDYLLNRTNNPDLSNKEKTSPEKEMVRNILNALEKIGVDTDSENFPQKIDILVKTIEKNPDLYKFLFEQAEKGN